MKKDSLFTRKFKEEIYRLVEAIPKGKVATYGQLAFLAGYPAHARMVGKVLKESPRSLRLPCHRVVNASGRCAPGWKEQMELLLTEQVLFLSNGNVDLEHFLWNNYEEKNANISEQRAQKQNHRFPKQKI